MRKAMSTLAMCAILLAGSSFMAQGQKFESGDMNLEVQFSPLSSNPIGISGIRGRSFLSENSAFRLNAFVGYNSETDVTQQEDSDNDLEELKDRETSFEIDIRPGYEIHLEGTDRLSPYFGGELVLGYKRTALRSESQNADGDVIYTKVTNGQTGGNGPSEQGFINLGLNGVAGVDYYFAKKLYLGAEFGFGFSYQSFSSVKVDSDADGFDEPDPVVQGGELNVGPNFQGALRLGYMF